MCKLRKLQLHYTRPGVGIDRDEHGAEVIDPATGEVLGEIATDLPIAIEVPIVVLPADEEERLP